MSHGYILDGIRHILRSPSNKVIASWPEDTDILDTDAGKIRIKDTRGNKPAKGNGWLVQVRWLANCS